MFLGGAVLPPHGRSLAEHGTKPLLHTTDKPIISLQSTTKILCHTEGDLCWCSEHHILLQLHMPENCRSKAAEGSL